MKHIWNTNSVVFIDTEVSPETEKILDYGAVTFDNRQLHTKSSKKFAAFIEPYHYICGHNVLEHDLHYIQKEQYDLFRQLYQENVCIIDTLYLSPLLFPGKPYHALLKDDKLQTDELNNPLNDSIKARELYCDICNAYDVLPEELQMIFFLLLHDKKEFSGFFTYADQIWEGDAEQQIRRYFKESICEHVRLDLVIQDNAIELAYCLALIASNGKYSIIPYWVHIHFPYIENLMKQLCGIPCKEGCAYCEKKFNIKKRLKAIFGYNEFRSYEGNPLQENAVKAALNQDSLLAIFPTGGGKSLTFQLPALIEGDAAKELTVVISPLQSLMKDQVDNLEKKGIADAVTVNGLLSPLERAEALERVENGRASLLYLSPEMLRSRTIERLCMSRNIGRFVIDEAHCFSAWGQDFRVDYLYIGDFIKELQEKKNQNKKNPVKQIPVSCFTATAKQKVISDIRDYFKSKLGIELQLFATDSTRKNLHYQVIYKETEEAKYAELRNLIEQKNCPTIVYASRTNMTSQLAEKLRKDGFLAKAFHGKMESGEKTANQEAFIRDEIQIIVATSAFGMGVDKSNVKLVIHYDISDSLENYIQESGRAGRDPSLQAECYVLFNENDLDKHFMLLNRTKLSMSEIQQVFNAIKRLTKSRSILIRSPLEMAREAGWEDSGREVETRVKAAIQALENAGYVRRGKNVPQVFANSILVSDMMEASKRIEDSCYMDEKGKEYAKRILQMLISQRSISKAGNDDAESRVDYISDRLGIEKADVINTINALRMERILADTRDLTAYIKHADTQNKTQKLLNKYLTLEKFLFSCLKEDEEYINLKELNEKAIKRNIKSSSVQAIKTIFYFWTIKNYIKKSSDVSSDRISVIPEISLKKLHKKIENRGDIATFIIKYLFEQCQKNLVKNSFLIAEKKEEILVQFSILEIKEECEKSRKMTISEKEIEDALLYLSKTDCIRLEGGFLVLYNGLEIERLVSNNRILYKVEDYKQLNEHYKQKIQQIHIVGEYANMMVRNYEQALQFVTDYFQMDYQKFLKKYFKGERSEEIERNITPAKYRKLFQGLSKAQQRIIQDDKSKYIVVAAGPGSGKTKVLVHKLASLLLLEDVKYEQLLMVTFSRAAATEFKQRLYELIENSNAYVEIKTFHSYCFDLLGKIGRLEGAGDIVAEAANMIRSGEVETGKITKTVIVIDEAQDMDEQEFALIQAIVEKNDEIRVIAVGDDDQNIYQFRGSDSKYFQSFMKKDGAVKYDLLENYRSSRVIIEFANVFASGIRERMKENPIIPVKEEQGIVRLIRHKSDNLEVPVVNNLLKTGENAAVCVLTNTNEEALKVLGLLLKRGKRAKLIQSNDDFNLYNLAELRYFLQTIKGQVNLPVISDGLWEKVKGELQKRYAESECLPICLNLLQTFEQAYKRKYLTDFEEFVRESKLEDFYQSNQETILISTIHKSKGREFDKVYLLLNHMKLQKDEDLRKLYVGITRAKKELYIHYNNEYLDEISANGVERIFDTIMYKPSEEIMSQLSYKDVYLDFFKGKERQMLQLYSGMELQVNMDGLWRQREMIVCFSRKYKDEMMQLQKLGYRPIRAKIRFVVIWKGKEDKKESVIVLPDIYYRRERNF